MKLFKKNPLKENFRIIVNSWLQTNGSEIIKSKRIYKYLAPVLSIIKILEKRHNDAFMIIHGLEDELFKQKSAYKNQIRLMTKCGCFQFINGEGVGETYTVHTLGGDKFLPRVFRQIRVDETGLRIFMEV